MGFRGFQGSFMGFHTSWLVVMVFQGRFMVFRSFLLVFQGCFIVFHGPRLVLTFFQGSIMVLKIVSFLLPIIGPEVHIWQTLCRVGMGPLKTLGKKSENPPS